MHTWRRIPQIVQEIEVITMIIMIDRTMIDTIMIMTDRRMIDTIMIDRMTDRMTGQERQMMSHKVTTQRQ